MSQPGGGVGSYVPRVSPAAIALYVYLQAIAQENIVIVSLRQLAASIQKSDAYVKKYLAELVDAGMIQRERRHGEDGTNLSSQYRLLV